MSGQHSMWLAEPVIHKVSLLDAYPRRRCLLKIFVSIRPAAVVLTTQDTCHGNFK